MLEEAVRHYEVNLNILRGTGGGGTGSRPSGYVGLAAAGAHRRPSGPGADAPPTSLRDLATSWTSKNAKEMNFGQALAKDILKTQLTFSEKDEDP